MNDINSKAQQEHLKKFLSNLGLRDDREPPRIQWYYNVGFTAIMIAGASVIIAGGWLLGALLEALM